LGAVMIKAQVLAGGRGKAGGIQKAQNVEEVEKHAAALIGSTLKTYQAGGGAGERIKSVLIEERSPFVKELYLGIAVNRAESLPNLIFSESGGMDIEEVARTTPEKVQRVPFNPSDSINSSLFTSALRLSPDCVKSHEALGDVAAKLAKIFVENDCSLIEINPLVIREDSKLMALDAKIIFDDNAFFRHPEYATLKDPDEEDPKEQRAKKFGLSYISLEGNVGCLVNGAGLAMATMDTIKAAGGEPANFLDVGGGATQEAVQEGFSIMLEDPNVKAILVNIFGGIMQCDLIANALVNANRAMDLKVPVVIRLEGTNVEKGRTILKESGLKLHIAKTITDAAEKAVQLAGEEN